MLLIDVIDRYVLLVDVHSQIRACTNQAGSLLQDRELCSIFQTRVCSEEARMVSGLCEAPARPACPRRAWRSGPARGTCSARRASWR